MPLFVFPTLIQVRVIILDHGNINQEPCINHLVRNGPIFRRSKTLHTRAKIRNRKKRQLKLAWGRENFSVFRGFLLVSRVGIAIILWLEWHEGREESIYSGKGPLPTRNRPIYDILQRARSFTTACLHAWMLEVTTYSVTKTRTLIIGLWN